MSAPTRYAAWPEAPERGRGRLRESRITLSHGGGGKAMRDLIQDVFVAGFANPHLAPLDDQARLPLAALAGRGDRLAFTTDSYVVDPLIFPGGDIGSLAVNGTINDLAVGGATPLFLSCSVILEEGLDVETLRRVAFSMRLAAEEAGVMIVTGDTKVVPRGAADKLFINTSGIGVIREGLDLQPGAAQPGDVILVNGCLGDHGAAILNARGDLALESAIESDSRPLHGLIDALLGACPGVRCLRDATRGGIATVLNEFAQSADLCMHLDEQALPIRREVRGMCEILGLDPLYLANEGKLVAILAPEQAEAALTALRRHPAGHDAAVIGEVRATPRANVLIDTAFGGTRMVDMLIGEQLPRIC